jgi:hypothetical protein
MGCGCNKNVAAQPAMGWQVDLTGTGKTFADGSTRKVYPIVSEANLAIAKLGLQGKVRPRPAPSAK